MGVSVGKEFSSDSWLGIMDGCIETDERIDESADLDNTYKQVS